MPWKAAPSVKRGLEEANERWPNRNKRSDGIIGDAAHSSRKSDHNPDSRGIVHAFDITHDPTNGVNCDTLRAMICFKRDSRIKYIIWDGGIWYGPHSSTNNLRWVRHGYTGNNQHTTHMHVSIGYTTEAENDIGPWYDTKYTTTEKDDEVTQDDINKIARQVATIIRNEGLSPRTKDDIANRVWKHDVHGKEARNRLHDADVRTDQIKVALEKHRKFDIEEGGTMD